MVPVTVHGRVADLADQPVEVRDARPHGAVNTGLARAVLIGEQTNACPHKIDEFDWVSAPSRVRGFRKTNRCSYSRQHGPTSPSVEVDRLHRNPGTRRTGWAEHRLAFNAPMIASLVAGEAPRDSLGAEKACSVRLPATAHSTYNGAIQRMRASSASAIERRSPGDRFSRAARPAGG